MSYLQEALLKKEKELKDIIEKVKESLQDVPEGRLRISHSGKTPQYYYRTKESQDSSKAGSYIKRENRQLAYRLAQKDYDQDLLREAENQLKCIQKLLKDYQADGLQKVYSLLNSYRKDMVVPKVVTDEMFAEQWKQIEYQGKIFVSGSAEIYTEKGERVRSKSEKIIADMLYRNGIQYRYEYPITLREIGTIYPDFTILNLKKRQEIYWEHLGMMDNSDYCEKALYKLNCYMKNGIYLGDKLLISYETSRRPLETAIIDKMIKVNLL